MRAAFSLSFAQITSAFVAFTVVALAHWFTIRRERESKRREQRINYLVNVFRALSKVNHHPKLYEVAEELEQAIGDVQLLGTPEQVRLARQFALELATNQSAGMDELLVSLRDGLRSELGAKPLPGRIQWLRVGRKKESQDEADLLPLPWKG
jgi:hypothetical protein